MDQQVGEKQLRYKAIQRVTVVGVVVNLVLAVSKTTIGFLAQSQSLVADGIHSLSDLLSDALVFLPPDMPIMARMKPTHMVMDGLKRPAPWAWDCCWH